VPGPPASNTPQARTINADERLTGTRMTAEHKELSFWDHLEELRWRLVRMVVYIVVAAAATWIFREQLLAMLQYPAMAGAEMAGLEEFSFRIFEAPGGFILMMQIALVAGLILAAPGVIIEMWLFIEPALEPGERKWVVLVVPLAIILFLGGVVFCYWISPRPSRSSSASTVRCTWTWS